MRQYANAQQSGTVARTPGVKPDKMQPVIDRMMMIAERLVKVEKLVESQKDLIESQNQRIEELTEKVITLEKKPTKDDLFTCFERLVLLLKDLAITGAYVAFKASIAIIISIATLRPMSYFAT